MTARWPGLLPGLQPNPQPGPAGVAPVVCSHTVEFGERGQRRLERAAQPAERRRLLLRDFVVERDDVLCTAGSRA